MVLYLKRILLRLLQSRSRLTSTCPSQSMQVDADNAGVPGIVGGDLVTVPVLVGQGCIIAPLVSHF